MMDFDLATALRDNVAAVLLLPLALAIGWLVVAFNKPPAKDAPVKSTAGILESVRMLASSESPWWHLQLQESLGSSIFQHNIPVPGGMYVLCSAKDQREVLLDEYADKPIAVYGNIDSITGRTQMGTRSTLDPRMKPMRKAVEHSFSSAEVNRMNSICMKYAKQWETDFLEKLADTDVTFDPSIELPKVVFKSIMEAALEYESTPEDYDFFASNYEVAVREFTFRQSVNPLQKVFGFMIPEVWAARNCCSALQDFVKKILKAYRENPNKLEHNTLIKAAESNPYDMSEEDRVAELLILLIAGFDTTGYTLANTLTLLAKHPKEMKELQQSLLQGDPEQSNDHLKRVITESKRLIPVSALSSVRVASRDFIFVDEPSSRKVKVPKGATIFLPQITAHQDEAVFEDATQFKPDRWENPTKEMEQSFTPFALGRRNCPGQSLAMAELYSVLPSILSKYEFELVAEGKLEYFMTLKYTNTKLRVKRAKV